MTAPPGQEFPECLRFVSGLGGGKLPCEPAFVHVVFFDPEMRILKPRRILVKCAHDGGELGESLIVIGGHVLDECRLEIQYAADSVDHTEKQPAWLREVSEAGIR